MPNSSSYSLSELYLFRTFTSREDFRRGTGQEAPSYNPARPPKGWFDPQAASATRRTVAYDPVLATTEDGIPMQDRDGKPFLDILLLTREEAATVNIWDNQSGYPQPTLAPVPIPLRALKENEELFFLMPQVVSVRDQNAQPDTGMFTARDRALLQAIANKIGVNQPT